MALSLSARFWRFVLSRFFKIQGQTLAENRAFAEQGKKFIRIPKGISIEAVNIDGINAEWIIPSGSLQDNVIIHLHGGGYVTGGIHTHKMMCILMAQTLKMKVLVPEYRLAPEHPFPAALEDAVKVYGWILAQNILSKNIIISGDSAGGGLSVAVAIQLHREKESLPSALICMSPWVDLTHRGKSHIIKAASEAVLTIEILKEWSLYYTTKENFFNPLVSPVYADLHELPPMLIQVGSDEILLDDSLMLAEKAKADGVDVTLKVWDGLWHVWQSLGNLIPESQKAFEEIAMFLHEHGLAPDIHHRLENR